MKKSLIKNLKCLVCNATNQWQEDIFREEYGEYRAGRLRCDNCQASYEIKDGIIDFLINPTEEVQKEREGAHAEVRIKLPEGKSFTINDESINKFKDIFKSLPRGDGGSFFKEGGSFQNFAEGAHRFYDFIKIAKIGPGAKVLEIGAGFCWASRELASRGCDLVSIDICNYLKIADLYIKEGLFFERVYADMDRLPFKDKSFDVIFAAAAVHHSSNLEKTFREFRRVLKKDGRMYLLNECFIGIFEKPQKHAEDFAFNDNYYSVPHWVGAMKKSGFKKVRVHYLSILKDFVGRKEARGRHKGWRFKLAKGLSALPWLDNPLFMPLIPHRILYRPKSVYIEAHC